MTSLEFRNQLWELKKFVDNLEDWDVVIRIIQDGLFVSKIELGKEKLRFVKTSYGDFLKSVSFEILLDSFNSINFKKEGNYGYIILDKDGLIISIDFFI